MLQVYSRMPQVANRSYAKAAQLFLSGTDWGDAPKEAAIPYGACQEFRAEDHTQLKAEAKTKVKAEAAKAKAETACPRALFRARRRRWARAAGR